MNGVQSNADPPPVTDTLDVCASDCDSSLIRRNSSSWRFLTSSSCARFISVRLVSNAQLIWTNELMILGHWVSRSLVWRSEIKDAESLGEHLPDRLS